MEIEFWFISNILLKVSRKEVELLLRIDVEFGLEKFELQVPYKVDLLSSLSKNH